MRKVLTSQPGGEVVFIIKNRARNAPDGIYGDGVSDLNAGLAIYKFPEEIARAFYRRKCDLSAPAVFACLTH